MDREAAIGVGNRLDYTGRLLRQRAIASPPAALLALRVGRRMGRRPALLWISLAVWLVTMFTPYFGVLLLGFCLFHVLSPLFTGKIDPSQAALESKVR